jgi:hypothetical protein
MDNICVLMLAWLDDGLRNVAQPVWRAIRISTAVSFYVLDCKALNLVPWLMPFSWHAISRCSDTRLSRARTVLSILMFHAKGKILLTDVVLSVYAAPLQRTPHTRSVRRIQRRLRLLLRLHFFAKRFTYSLRVVVDRCPHVPKYAAVFRRPFYCEDYEQIMRLALNESFGVPHLGRAAAS